jgi:hypothetical protein
MSTPRLQPARGCDADQLPAKGAVDGETPGEIPVNSFRVLILYVRSAGVDLATVGPYPFWFPNRCINKGLIYGTELKVRPVSLLNSATEFLGENRWPHRFLQHLLVLAPSSRT